MGHNCPKCHNNKNIFGTEYEYTFDSRTSSSCRNNGHKFHRLIKERDGKWKGAAPKIKYKERQSTFFFKVFNFLES